MEFITTEQFLKLDKKVQEVFIDWWKPSIGDLFKYNYGYSNIDIINLKSIKEDTEKSKYSAHIIPLLSEGQLRKFIEDKVGTKYIELVYYSETGYYIYVEDLFFEDLGEDLLQAYWKVAVQIAKGSIDN